MGATFVITLREAFEAALILGILYTYLKRTDGLRHYWCVSLGAAVGLLASIGLGVALNTLSGPLLDLGPDVVSAAAMFLAVALLTWHGWWMQQHARVMQGDVVRRLENAHPAQRHWIVGMLAFTAVFREGSETVLFLWGLFAGLTSRAGWVGAVGGVLGIGAAATLGWLIFRGTARISLRTFFTATSLLVLLLAAGLFSAGFGRLEGLGWVPSGATLWDTSHLLSDHQGIGGFLSGLVGYRARPSALEAGAYLTYLVLGGALLFGRRLVPAPARP